MRALVAPEALTLNFLSHASIHFRPRPHPGHIHRRALPCPANTRPGRARSAAFPPALPELAAGRYPRRTPRSPGTAQPPRRQYQNHPPGAGRPFRQGTAHATLRPGRTHL